jgi:hypothetical protein
MMAMALTPVKDLTWHYPRHNADGGEVTPEQQYMALAGMYGGEVLRKELDRWKAEACENGAWATLNSKRREGAWGFAVLFFRHVL